MNRVCRVDVSCTHTAQRTSICQTHLNHCLRGLARVSLRLEILILHQTVWRESVCPILFLCAHPALYHASNYASMYLPSSGWIVEVWSSSTYHLPNQNVPTAISPYPSCSADTAVKGLLAVSKLISFAFSNAQGST